MPEFEIPPEMSSGEAPAPIGERLPPSQPRQGPGLIRNIITAVIVGAVIVGAVWYFDRPGSAISSQAVRVTASASGVAPRVGKEAPDFQVTGTDGQPYQLSQFRGQPVWLSFWATWCPPCRAENPDIQSVYEANRDQGLVVLALSIGEDGDTVRNYASRVGLTYTMGLDQTTEVAALYRIAGIPTHFFIDRNGIIREWRIGGLSKKVMEKKVQEIVASAGAGQPGSPR